MYVAFVLCKNVNISEYSLWIKRTSRKPRGRRSMHEWDQITGQQENPLRHLAQRNWGSSFQKSPLELCHIIFCQGHDLTGGFTDLLTSINNIMKIEDLEQ